MEDGLRYVKPSTDLMSSRQSLYRMAVSKLRFAHSGLTDSDRTPMNRWETSGAYWKLEKSSNFWENWGSWLYDNYRAIAPASGMGLVD